LNKKILFLPKYPRLGASSRVRTFQFLSLWEDAGYQINVSSFFNEAYLKSLYAHISPGVWNVLTLYLKRFGILFSAWRYDVLIIEKELFPYLPAYAEFLLELFGKKYIVDYDDAVFHNYDLGKNWVVRNFMKSKIDHVMRYASLVFVGSKYLKERAIQAGAKRVVDLPTVIEGKKYFEFKGQRSKGNDLESVELGMWNKVLDRVWVGWIGSPSTMKYLRRLISVLERLGEEVEFGFLIINGELTIKNKELGGKVEVKHVVWTEEGEVDAIRNTDIGIMPLPDDPWERGKCAYKLIQYMACGLPVVASPVGMNSEVVTHGENGFLAASEEEWIQALKMLIQDAALRKRMGEKGLEMVKERFTVERNFEIMKWEVERLLSKD
jgi:glycosyltransferase involved in cell wall biosynthesis